MSDNKIIKMKMIFKLQTIDMAKLCYFVDDKEYISCKLVPLFVTF